MNTPWFRESAVAVSILLFIVGSITAAVVWVDDQPGQWTWILRIGATATAVVGLGGYLWIHFQPGKAPDHLHALFGEYFYREGFAFAIGPIHVHEGSGWLEIGFQNQHAAACLGRITLRPARNFFLQRAAIEPLRVEIRCEAGAFGLAYVPFPIPREYHGQKGKFDIGASAVYPSGPGELIRYRNWAPVLDDERFGGDLPLVGELARAIAVQKSHTPSAVTLEIPKNINENIPAACRPHVVTLWRWGDSADRRAEELAAETRLPHTAAPSR